MKTLLLTLALASSVSLYASECSVNPYGLTKPNLVVAFNWSKNYFDDRTGNKVHGEYFFNSFIDESCEHVVVSARDIVSCVNSEGQITSVGSLAKKEGRYKEWDFYSVNWSKDVVIKSLLTDEGCIYGLAILNNKYEP